MANADRVLIIDDDNTVCELVSALAKTMGLECSAATDGANFAELVTADTSVIILDLMMPGMDGIEVLRMLGERQCKAHILLMSGMDRRVLETAEKLAESLGLSVAGHLQKPFPLPELKSKLESLATKANPPIVAESPHIDVADDEIRRAIDRNEFVNYYQPQINIATGLVMGVEALARWQHPRRGILSPDHFIARIEALGLMDTLCLDTAQQAMIEAHGFALTDGSLPRLSLNASMSSLHDLSFPDTFFEMAKQSGYGTDKIAIEITESRLASEISRTLDVLTRLRMKGFQLSIDDFGAGYSMMRRLQNVPATELKIDKGIVEHMDVNDSDRVMVEKIVEMGHELKMEVIAEGVANQVQLDMLRRMGCDGAQGYWFSRPIPAAEMTKWLADRESPQAADHS